MDSCLSQQPSICSFFHILETCFLILDPTTVNQSISAGMAPKRSSPSSSGDTQPDQKRTRPQRGAATKASTIISQAARNESTLEHNLSIPPEALLRETLSPLRETEKNEWKAWVEIESDPVSPANKRFLIHAVFESLTCQRPSSTAYYGTWAFKISR